MQNKRKTCFYILCKTKGDKPSATRGDGETLVSKGKLYSINFTKELQLGRCIILFSRYCMFMVNIETIFGCILLIWSNEMTSAVPFTHCGHHRGQLIKSFYIMHSFVAILAYTSQRLRCFVFGDVQVSPNY